MMRALFEQLSLFTQTSATPPAGKKPVAPPPLKQRHLQLGSRIVSYTLRRGRRKTLALSIDDRGLRIGAPRHVTLAEIEAFAVTHASWVLKKLDEHSHANVQRNITVRDGVSLPLLGAEITVSIIPGSNRIRWQADGPLVLEVRADADCDVLARRALQRRATEVFGERIAHYAAKMGHQPPRLGLSSARTRWGSCSKKSGIRLNWRLIHLPLALIDYVVAHELAHLVEMNHGPRFWAAVENIYPDWRNARRELKVRAAKLPMV